MGPRSCWAIFADQIAHVAAFIRLWGDVVDDDFFGDDYVTYWRTASCYVLGFERGFAEALYR